MRPVITLDQIDAFLTVARTGGIRRAAERMNLSQPAVSGRLSQLEDRMGRPLFVRDSTGVRLTREGEMFRDYADRIAAALDGIDRDIVARDKLGGILRIGVAETIAQAWLPALLRRLYDQYPAVTVEIAVDISQGLRDQLVTGAIDLAVLMGPISHPEVENTALPEFELAWYRAPERADVDLSGVPVITYARNSRPYREMRGALLDRLGSAIRLFPTSSLSAGFRMIADDVGVGAFPAMLAADHVAAGRIVAFDPGWVPAGLNFTTSWRSAPGNFLAREAATIAIDCARRHHEGYRKT